MLWCGEVLTSSYNSPDMEKGNKETFIKFLNAQGVSEISSEMYVNKLTGTIADIYAEMKGMSSVDMFNINGASAVESIIEDLLAYPKFCQENEKNHRIESSALSWLRKFQIIRELFLSERDNDEPQMQLIAPDKEPLQQIVYGAPGTGKSYSVNKIVSRLDRSQCFRTTFHPDSDYASFVGSYKPTTRNGLVTYNFSPQVFTQAYIKAWSDTSKPVYLVVEEINRGNCAQIFGDLFQLLDRNVTTGFSNYTIVPDADLENYISEALRDVNIPQVAAQHTEDIKKGKVLLLPGNLHIWATMNTSDQSLFPIDSAFKRRWNWKYVPISDQSLGWGIRVGNHKYDWWEFISSINDTIAEQTQSEDKKLGYFFVSCGQECEISADDFVGKVVFYLWYDVFRDLDYEGPVFRKSDNGLMQFADFYNQDGSANLAAIDQLMNNIGVKAIDSPEEIADDHENID